MRVKKQENALSVIKKHDSVGLNAQLRPPKPAVGLNPRLRLPKPAVGLYPRSRPHETRGLGSLFKITLL